MSNFLTEDQENELRDCPIDFINNEVIPDIVTPLAERDDMEEINTMLVNNGVLLLPDNEDARNAILDVASGYSAMDLQICGKKRPS